MNTNTMHHTVDNEEIAMKYNRVIMCSRKRIAEEYEAQDANHTSKYTVIHRNIEKYITTHYPTDEQIEVMFQKLKYVAYLYFEDVFKRDHSLKLYHRLNDFRASREGVYRRKGGVYRFRKYVMKKFGESNSIKALVLYVSRYYKQIQQNGKLMNYVYSAFICESTKH